jgi:N,N'-diacetyllegionaminate synthase
MRVYIIAEAGVNHNGDFEQALKLVDAAVDAKADAIKFQAFDADKLQRSDLKNLELGQAQFMRIAEYCKSNNIDFLCTAFDNKWLEFVYFLDVKYIKIPSSKILDKEYLLKCSDINCPIILSTGLSDTKEVYKALGYLGRSSRIILMHCTTSFPVELECVNMLAMKGMRDKFHKPVGYSDHTTNNYAVVMAVSMGASIIEKHLTLDRLSHGPDHLMSASPEEFKEYVGCIRMIEKAKGDGVKRIEKCAEDWIYLKEQYNFS